MSEVLLATLGGLGVALGLASARLRDLPLSEPLVALAAGVAIGPGLGALEFAPEQERAALALTAEISVALAVMSAALRHSMSEVRAHLSAVGLLLLVVLPVMAVVSAGLGVAVLASVVLHGLTGVTRPAEDDRQPAARMTAGGQPLSGSRRATGG